MSEFHDEYSESLDAEFRKLEDALLSDEVGLLAPSEPIRLPPDASVAEAVTRMVDSHRAGVVIVDPAGRLVGIFTERDLLRAVADRVHSSEARIREWMTSEPITVTPETSAEEAAQTMLDNGFRHLPVVEGDRAIGIVSIRDVARWITEDADQ